MRGLVKKVAVVFAAAAVIAGTAYAVAGELDPASVPQGFFALGNRASDVFKIKVGSGPEHVYRDGAEVTAQHIRDPGGRLVRMAFACGPGVRTGRQRHADALRTRRPDVLADGDHGRQRLRRGRLRQRP
jgi:hypothetical protein